jgi:nicotinamidase-related amidase
MSDHQNDLCHPDGKFSIANFPQEVQRRGVLPNTKRLLNAFREMNMPLVHVQVLFRPEHLGNCDNFTLFQMARQVGAMVEGSWGAKIHDELAPLDHEIVVTKRRISGFYGTELDNVIKSFNATTVIFTGVVTTFSVEGTVRHGADMGYDCVVAEDCCSTGSEDEHQSSLRTMTFLATISNSDEILATLKS